MLTLFTKIIYKTVKNLMMTVKISGKLFDIVNDYN